MPSAAGLKKPRVLHCITVYNDRSFAPQAIQSAARMETTSAECDVLVLDDTSPEPGSSEQLRDISTKLGANYYRSPRNLGIPRNTSLGLLAAAKNGYDYVTINNSDVLFPANLLTELLLAIRDPNVGSVTAWSNDLSMYAITNDDPDCLNDQGAVNWLGEMTSSLFSGRAIDIPGGSAFCVMIPTAVVTDVGIMDPVFDCGGNEETDWKLRSLEAGYRICLAPGAFVYHWRDPAVTAGVISRRHAAPKNEAIIDWRYPAFRSQLRKFRESDVLEPALRTLTKRIIDRAAREFGYAVDIGHRGSPLGPADDRVRIEVEIGPADVEVRARYKGFAEQFSAGRHSIRELVVERFGMDPAVLSVYARGAVASAVEREFKEVSIVRPHNYPTFVVTRQL
ncbi:MAG: glycosyltransferase [Candidatus Tumulicola sp.]